MTKALSAPTFHKSVLSPHNHLQNSPKTWVNHGREIPHSIGIMEWGCLVWGWDYIPKAFQHSNIPTYSNHTFTMGCFRIGVAQLPDSICRCGRPTSNLPGRCSTRRSRPPLPVGNRWGLGTPRLELCIATPPKTRPMIYDGKSYSLKWTKKGGTRMTQETSTTGKKTLNQLLN